MPRKHQNEAAIERSRMTAAARGVMVACFQDHESTGLLRIDKGCVKKRILAIMTHHEGDEVRPCHS
jgi:RNase P/RNase MRP subunit POP5